MKKCFFISALAISFFFFGCASIVHGPTQTVDFTSQPKGARLTIDGKDYGKTPKSVNLLRVGRLKGESSEKISYDVKIELEGFYPYELKIKREMDGWFIGNILIGGLIGIIIDAANGSMYKLSPDQVIATLGRQTALTEEDDLLVKLGDSDDLGTIYYPKAKLILFRRGKKEAEQPFDFSINSSINGSFVPYSYMEVDIEVTEEPVTICYNNGCEAIYEIEIGAGETKYIECSILKNNIKPQIMEIEPGNGKFYSEQAKFYQNKREKK